MNLFAEDILLPSVVCVPPSRTSRRPEKNAEKITFLHFFCIFLATLTSFSSLVAYLCSEIEKMLYVDLYLLALMGRNLSEF